jgi:uncharacterized protein YukE
MPIDEARLRKAALAAANTSNGHLKVARQRVQAAQKRFDGGFWSGVGAGSWDSVGAHLERRRGEEFAAAYQQLMQALKKADDAVKQASQAVSRMADAAR